MISYLRTKLSWPVLIAMLALVVAIGFVPAAAHVGNRVGHLFRNHIKPKVVTGKGHSIFLRRDLQPNTFVEIVDFPGLAGVEISCGSGASTSGYGTFRDPADPDEYEVVIRRPDGTSNSIVVRGGTGASQGGFGGSSAVYDIQLGNRTGSNARMAEVHVTVIHGGEEPGLGNVCRVSATVRRFY